MQTVLNSLMQELPASAPVPELVHLIPAGIFSGADGRGPFDLADPAALIAASMMPGRNLPIDINHSTDLAGKTGGASPAVGWIVSLESRGDGIWGRVQWNVSGRRHLEDRDYGYLSPVFTTPQKGPQRVMQLLRAALTNDPNLTLTSLHHRRHAQHQEEEERATRLNLSATDLAVARALGLDPEKMAETANTSAGAGSALGLSETDRQVAHAMGLDPAKVAETARKLWGPRS